MPVKFVWKNYWRVLKKYVQNLQACEKSVRKVKKYAKSEKVYHKYSIVDVRIDYLSDYFVYSYVFY